MGLLSVLMVCASCGHENSDTARFCEACGAVLGGESGERRKVVTVLFCDVVVSTALGESTDPEALRALLAHEAVTIVDDSYLLDVQGDAYADLGEVLILAAKAEDAAAALEQAHERYERKGNVVSAQRTQARLAKLREAASR
jgi:class 3 adenylate cyclase